MHDPTVAEELARYDEQFTPRNEGFRAGIDTLPDGTYEFDVSAVDLTRTEKTREALLRLELHVSDGDLAGQEVEHVYFFRDQRAVNRLGADLVSLGLDANNWTTAAGRPFSRELPRHLGTLRGLRFRAKKTTSQGDQKTFHNLQILGPLSQARDMPAPYLPPAQPPSGVDDEIPF